MLHHRLSYPSLTFTHTDTQRESYVLKGTKGDKKLWKRENEGNHCDCDKVHERKIAVNAWRGAGSFVRQSAELLIESDR